MKYFDNSELNTAKKQRNKYRLIYIIVAIIYAIISAGCVIWYSTLPYKSPTITAVKFVHYPVTFIFIAFSFVYLFITFKRANKHYKLVENMVNGLKEETTAVYLETDHQIQDKDGVDMKALIFLEWNKYKKEYFERKVMVFGDREIPVIPENATVKFITQGNVLIEYEIIDLPKED